MFTILYSNAIYCTAKVLQIVPVADWFSWLNVLMMELTADLCRLVWINLASFCHASDNHMVNDGMDFIWNDSMLLSAYIPLMITFLLRPTAWDACRILIQCMPKKKKKRKENNNNKTKPRQQHENSCYTTTLVKT